MFKITMIPAKDGDCFLVEIGDSSQTSRILIDGGRRETCRAHLRPLIANLPKRNGPILDLVVLTHIDADHIEGLLDLLGSDAPPAIGEIWFNDFSHLRIAQGRALAAPWSNRRSKNMSIDVLGVRQAVELADVVRVHNWGWNSSFKGGPVMVPNEEQLPRIKVRGGGTITLLGPAQSALADFEQYWTTELGKLDESHLPTLESRQRPIPKPGNLERLAQLMDVSDRAKPNGTSIAFIIEFQGQRALFLADAHPDAMASALQRYCGGQQRIEFSVIKVAHHGSAVNNTSVLLDRLQSLRWLISSDGSRHRHPDPEALARIVLAPVRGKTLFFNYRTKYNEVWSHADMTKYYGYAAEYATETMSISL